MAEIFLRPNETTDQFYNRCTNVTNFDCSEGEMLWWMMGPRRLPLREILPVSVAMVVVFLTGVVGNVAVCVVIVRHPSMRTTTTNYYLFSLALSDLLLLLFGLPNDLSVYWHQYPYSFGIVFCKLRALISEAASYVSVLTIVAFSLERYLAICHPLHLYAMAGLRRALRIVAALWVVSLLAAGPFALYTTVSYHDYPPAVDQSTENTDENLTWLNNNVDPWETVEKKWTETSDYRLKHIYDGGNITEYYNKYPASKQPQGYTLLQKDFNQMYPGKENNLFSTLNLKLEDILAYAKGKAEHSRDKTFKTDILNLIGMIRGSGNSSLESAFCAMLELPTWYLCELSSLLFFILPGFIILALYVRMGLRIRYVMGSTHAHKPGSAGTLNGVNGSVHGEARQAQSRKTIIRMLAAVVVAFFVCWAPFHFQRLFFIYGATSQHYHTINQYLFSVAGLLYYVSATVNPILYNVMSNRYRIAFKETLCCSKIRRKKSKYREHSSIRETTVNHTSDGSHLVRVRSQSHDRRNRVDLKALRRCSYTETMTLCSQKRPHQYYDKKKSILRSERSNSNNNENQVMFNEKERDDYKLDTDLEGEDSNININISIHVHK